MRGMVASSTPPPAETGSVTTSWIPAAAGGLRNTWSQLDESVVIVGYLGTRLPGVPRSFLIASTRLTALRRHQNDNAQRSTEPVSRHREAASTRGGNYW